MDQDLSDLVELDLGATISQPPDDWLSYPFSQMSIRETVEHIRRELEKLKILPDADAETPVEASGPNERGGTGKIFEPEPDIRTMLSAGPHDPTAETLVRGRMAQIVFDHGTRQDILATLLTEFYYDADELEDLLTEYVEDGQDQERAFWVAFAKIFSMRVHTLEDCSTVTKQLHPYPCPQHGYDFLLEH